MQWKRYKKEAGYSYTLGAFPTMELVERRPELVEEVILSYDLKQPEYFTGRLEEAGLAYRFSDSLIRRLAPKGNTYMAGIFRKELPSVRAGSHVVLDRVSDMGNLGNIIRTLSAMGIYDLVLIGNCCDIYHPRVVRASMGSFFYLRSSSFETMDDYLAVFGRPDRELYLFMLSEEGSFLPQISPPPLWSLVFGNEGSGLPDAYRKYGRGVMIPQSDTVDSLNLTTAAAIGAYHFMADKMMKGIKSDEK